MMESSRQALSSSACRPLRVGLYGQPKKYKQFYSAFMEHCSSEVQPDGDAKKKCRLECIPLEVVDQLNRDDDTRSAKVVRIAADGSPVTNIDVLFHKLSDEFATENTSPQSRAILKAFEDMLKAHEARQQRCFVFEAFPAIRLLTNRFETLAALDSCSALKRLNFFVPYTEKVSSMMMTEQQDGAGKLVSVGTKTNSTFCDDSTVALWKTNVACGEKSTHYMKLTTKWPKGGGRNADESTSSTKTTTLRNVPQNEDLIAQEYILNAMPVVFKVYVVGQTVHIRYVSMERLSEMAEATKQKASSGGNDDEENFDSQNKQMFFAFSNADKKEEEQNTLFAEAQRLFAPGSENMKALQAAAVTIQAQVLSGMSLFGFDVLAVVPKPPPPDASVSASPAKGSGAGRPSFYIVDINYFPGYKDVPNVNALVEAEMVRRYDDGL